MACENYWVQCGDCHMWKKLTEAMPSSSQSWFCWMHPDPFILGCHHKSTGNNQRDFIGKCPTNDKNDCKKVTFSDTSCSNRDAPVPLGNGPTLDSWVCCHECGRWRRLPCSSADVVSDKENAYWCCAMHPDPSRRNCRNSLPSLRQQIPIRKVSTVAFPSAACIQGLTDTMTLVRRQAGHLL